MFKYYRTVIWECDNGLQEEGAITYNQSHGVAYPKRNPEFSKEKGREVATLQIHPSGTVTRNAKIMEARDLLSLGDIVIKKVQDAVQVALSIGNTISLVLSEDDVDNDVIINGNISHKV